MIAGNLTWHSAELPPLDVEEPESVFQRIEPSLCCPSASHPQTHSHYEE